MANRTKTATVTALAVAAVTAMAVLPPFALPPATASDHDPAAVETAVVVTGDGHTAESGHEHDHEAGTAEDAIGGLDGASGTTAPFFSESGACGTSAGVATPLSTTNSSPNRSLPSGHQVRGPYGDFFGRNYTDVEGSQVLWTVPMSGGARVKVHERALPAFQLVTANLAAEAAKGNWYRARLLGSFVWRRIGGSYRMSNHAFGVAIDINWDRNPYSGSLDNVLITDMPAWYVAAWTEAGFCWGGQWETIKDPMHFSWMGPAATPGYGDVPAPYPPVTARSGFDTVSFSGQGAFGPPKSALLHGFADGNRDGGPDLIRVRPWGSDDVVLEFARSSRDFLACGVSRIRVRGLQAAGDRYLVADFDGDARTDVWAIDETGPKVTLRIATHDGGYATVDRVETGASVADHVDYAAADYDRDGVPDLYVMHHARGTKVRVEVWSGAGGFQTRIVNATTRINGDSAARLRLGVGDRSADGIPDVFATRVFSSLTLLVLDGAAGYRGPPEKRKPSLPADRQGVYGLGDHDGDGRTDMLMLDRTGRVAISLGGVQTASPDFWLRPADWACTDTVTGADPWDYNGDRAADMTVGAPGEDLSGATDAGVVHVVTGTAAGPNGAMVWYQDLLADSPSEAGDGFGATVGWGDFNGDGYADLVAGVPREDLGPTADAGLVNVVYGSDRGLAPDHEDFPAQIWHRDRQDVTGAGAAGDRLGWAMATGDFDGDGFDDLAIGAPDRSVDGHQRAGVVLVVYGSARGLRGARHQVLSENYPGVPGAAEPNDGFGSAVAAADVDRDGFADLVVGVPGESTPAFARSGSVTLIYGSGDGLTASGSTRFHQGLASVSGSRKNGAAFGAALAAGDFNGDGSADVAVGAPGTRVGSVPGAGMVALLTGSTTGMAGGEAGWTQATTGLNGSPGAGDRFGSALAAADFDDDGFDELVIGSPGARVGVLEGAGVVLVMAGSPVGPDPEDSQRWHDGKVAGSAQVGAGFGTSFATGDFDRDLVADLLIGSPLRDVTGIRDAGLVALLYGRTGQGLGRPGWQEWHQGASVGDTAEAGDGFGALAR